MAKKNYMTPKSLVMEIDSEDVIATSIPMGSDGESADPNYGGGGDAKARIVDFSDEDMF